MRLGVRIEASGDWSGQALMRLKPREKEDPVRTRPVRTYGVGAAAAPARAQLIEIPVISPKSAKSSSVTTCSFRRHLASSSSSEA